MKYHTISTSSLSSEGRKSTLTLYTDPDFTNEKASSTEEISSIRGELEIAQRALKLQTRRCRQLVAEYTKRLQEKEQQYQSEKLLRDNQLAKVLRALLIFEARLKQEQKYISHQLKEKDVIIKKQRDDIHKLSNQYCKHCNQFYSPVHNMESLDSSSEYVATDYQDYQSSNFESLDSSSETYATISEKDYPKKAEKIEPEGKIFAKNKIKDVAKRGRKIGHRKSVGTYFEVLKLRNGNISPSSNDDNTSNDYENLESLPPESISDKVSVISDRIESIFSKCTNLNLTEDNLDKHDNQFVTNTEADETLTPEDAKHNQEVTHDESNKTKNVNDSIENQDDKVSKITDNIPVFEDDNEANENWYASASDQEDDQQRDIYRNNPVLECMNQILMQNINDNINSPPKTPTLERKFNKSKRVKFSDEEMVYKENELNAENLELKTQQQNNYYETPVQKAPNFYETPQSIYSNDYEQILSKCNETFQSTEDAAGNKAGVEKPKESHYYVDMDTKSETESEPNVRKSKIGRIPPALPPKPANLLSKYKLQNIQKSPQKVSTSSVDSEPDYCSISELNLPTKKISTSKKLNVVAEINISTQDVKVSEKHIILHSPKQKDPSHYDLDLNDKTLVSSKPVEKSAIQIAKQTAIKSETSPTKTKPPKIEPEIPKLPQVSEIIIPDENETQKDERVSHDNYMINNSQILKLKNPRESARRSILMGSSVSSLITSFNNQQLLSEIQNKSPRKLNSKKMFSSFECLQNIEKPKPERSPDSHDFEKFDLSQNFEEFKLDDCEIEEYNDNSMEEVIIDTKIEPDKIEHVLPDILTTPTKLSSTRVELVRATNDIAAPQINPNTIQQLKKKLELEKNKEIYQQATINTQIPEQNYEHFLECTGLSSKSILTPSRLLSNHKSMLKPKDVKLRSKVKSSAFERQGSTIKYWSEPYI